MSLPIVFLGPSLSHKEARRFLEADYRPPIRRGDLERAPAHAVVGIVDGMFDHGQTITPAEIRSALSRGVRIFGSSSMGALRAVEVPGIEGVGRIFEMLKSGDVEDDDEVTIAFDPDTLAPLCEPMVNIRHSVDRLARPGTISSDVARAIVRAAKGLSPRERVYSRILEVAGLAERADLAHLTTMLTSYDLKREDAITLLERLGEMPAKKGTPNEPSPPAVDHPAALEEELRATFSPDAPVHFWEFGPPVSFAAIVRFLKLTSAFPEHARAAVARFVLQGNELEAGVAGDAAPTEEDLRERLVQRIGHAWGWTTEEETRASLHDLGVGAESFRERVDEEVATLARVMTVARNASPEFEESLRVELFMDDLVLKRAAVRTQILHSLAALGRVSRKRATASELTEATLKLSELADARDGDEVRRVLGWWGVSSAEVTEFTEALALARRATREIRASWRIASRARVRGVDRLLRATPKRGGRRFSTTKEKAFEYASRLCDIVGITRVSMITGLRRFGVPNAQAFRPDGRWSSTVGSGKSDSVLGAKVGAVMEEVEKWAQEQYPREGHAPREVVASFDALRRSKRSVLDPRSLDLPYDSCFDPKAPIGWRECHDLLGGRTVLVPSAVLSFQRLPNDIFYSPQGGRKVISSNGLASGFSLEEALTHALCECIERHANILATIVDGNPGAPGRTTRHAIATETLPASTRKLLKKIAKDSSAVRIVDISSELRVPVIAATLLESVPPTERLFGYDKATASGFAAHPDPEVAINMALLESVQTVMTNVAGAREDLTLQARSLGRHERSSSIAREAFSVLRRVDLPQRTFEELGGFVSRDAREDVRWLVERVRDAGLSHVLFADYSLPNIHPARVVRVIVPGLETLDPFHTGTRARFALLRDLLPLD